jgi:hypothetical protein
MSDEKKILDTETALNLTENNQPIDFSAYDVLDLEMCDLSAYKNIRFKENSEINLGGAEPLPDILDVSRCASVDLSGRDLSSLKKPIVMKKGSSFSFDTQMQSGFGLNNIPPLTNVDFSRSAKVSVSGTDLSAYSSLRFADDATVNLSNCTNIPKDTDLSNCDVVSLCNVDLSQIKNLKFKDGAKVNLSGCTNIPENLDLSRCAEVTIKDTDLSQFKNIHFKDDAIVDLSGCTNIPENIDFSRCKAVYLADTDLSGISDLKLKDGAYLDLSSCKTLPEHVDFDKCSYVDLSYTDLMFRTDIKFKDGAEVNMRKAENIPDEVDFSPCAKLNLRQCDLGSSLIGGSRTMTFREGAEVSLYQCKAVPPNTDFSPCSKLNLSGCDLSGQTELKLRDNARVAICGATNIPSANNLNQCQEIWAGTKQAQSLDLGNAHVVLSGLGPKQIDISKLNTVTTAQCHDEILGTSMMTLLGTKEFIFKNQTQYQKYLENNENLRIPEDVKIVFTDERKELSQALSAQQGELPALTKADAQGRRIDNATERHREKSNVTEENKTPQTTIDVSKNQTTR